MKEREKQKNSLRVGLQSKNKLLENLERIQRNKRERMKHKNKSERKSKKER